MMKKSFLTLGIALSMMLLSCASNQVNKTEGVGKGASVQATLKDGRVISGKLEEGIAEDAKQIRIKSGAGEEMNIAVKDLVGLDMKDSKQTDRWQVFKTQRGLYPSSADRKEPVLLKVVYDGEYMMALEEPNIEGGGSRYFFHIKGDEAAIQYFEHDSRGAKAVPDGEAKLRETFFEFPRVKMAMDAGKLDYKKDIVEFVRLMDREFLIK